MSNYNLENIFVRWEESREDLTEWLSNKGRRPVNTDMFETLNGIKNIREQTKEADTFHKVSELREDLDLIEKPSPRFENLDNLKDTSKGKLDEQYNNVLILIRREIKSVEKLTELKEIPKKFKGAEEFEIEKLDKEVIEKLEDIVVHQRDRILSATSIEEIKSIAEEVSAKDRIPGFRKQAEFRVRFLIKRGILPEETVLPRL